VGARWAAAERMHACRLDRRPPLGRAKTAVAEHCGWRLPHGAAVTLGPVPRVLRVCSPTDTRVGVRM
jgi:hypothetical protein